MKSKGPLYGLIAALFIVGLAAVTLLIMSADPAAGRDAPANTLTGNPEESPTPSTGAVTSESSPEEIAAGFVAATTADDDAGPTTTDADVGANDGSETQAERAPSEAPSPNRAAELAGQERRRVAHPAREPRAASADSNNSDRAPVKTIHQGRRGATIITTYDDED